MAPIADGQAVNALNSNAAWLDAQSDDTAVGKISFANTDPLSGPTITNIQLNVNNLIQNFKIFFTSLNEGKVTWSSPNLSFADDIVVYFEDTGFSNTILSSTSPFVIADGDSVYFTLDRTMNANIVPTISSTIPLTKDTFRFVTRIGSSLIFWDNTYLRDGISAIIGEGTSNVNFGLAGRLAVYPADNNIVGDAYVQNTYDAYVSIVPQPTRGVDIDYMIPNPGDSVSQAYFVLTEGYQVINGYKIFTNNILIEGDLTVTGTTTTIDSVNLTVEDKLITLNHHGGSTSAYGSGIEFEENTVITGYIKTSADRLGFDLKAPATAGVAKVVTDVSSWTYTLPGHSGTVMTDVVDDTTPQLGGDLDVNGHFVTSASNGNILISPNGTGRVRLSNSVSTTQYIDEKYFHGTTLTASTTAVQADLTFDTTVYKSEIAEYQIREATTNATRVGRLLMCANGASGVAATQAYVIDFSNDTADVGVTWSAAMNSNNAEISYITTANTKTMNSLVRRFLG